MSGLGHVAWRSLAERRGRAALTLVGLVLGIALFTSALVTLASADSMVQQASADGMGSADVVVSAVGNGSEVLSGFNISTFPAEVGERLADVGGADATAALLTFPSAITTEAGLHTEIGINTPPPVVITGGRAAALVEVFGLSLATGRFAEADGELVVSGRHASELGISAGDTIKIDTPTGTRHVTVTGITARRGLGRLSTLAFTDLSVAQAWTARPGEVSQIGVRLRDGVARERWMEQAQVAAGTPVDIQDLDELLAFMRSFVSTFTGALTALSASVVFLGGFLLYLTMSMAVIERTRLYGLLAALGARQRQVRRVVLGESLLLGVAAAVAGLPLGVGLAVVIRTASGRLLEQLGVDEGLLVVPWWSLAFGALVAVAATMFAALAPARRAASLDTVDAIRSGSVGDPPGSRWTGIVGAAVLIGGGVSLAATSSMAALGAGMLGVLIGAVLLTPYLLRPLAAVLGGVTARLAPGTGEVAVHHLTSHRVRSAYTLALVMLVMALTIAAGATHVSFVESLDRQVDREFGDDLRVEAASTLDEAFLRRLATVPGVDEMTSTASGNGVAVNGGEDVTINVLAVDPDTYFDVSSVAWIDGDDAEARSAIADGGAAIVPEGLATSLGTRRGGRIALRGREGVAEFLVVGTAEVTNIPPTITLSRDDASRHFGVRGVQMVQMNVAPGADTEEVRQAILQRLADAGTFIVSTAPELKADARAQVAGALNGVFVLLALAAVVGVLGLANTMTMSVVQRVREIGILRAIGARARHLRLMVIAESLTLVAAAFVLSIPVGLALSGPLLAGVRRGLGNTTVPYSFPWKVFPIVVIAGLVAAGLASLLPAQRAVRTDIDATLRDE